jgi:hypothetical protein
MPVLATLAVVFVGVGGPHSARIDHQMQSLLHHDARVVTRKVPERARHALASHASEARQIVQRLGTDGVIAGEVVRHRRHQSLRIVVYGADGGLKDLVEIPIDRPALDRPDLEALRSNLIPDVVAMTSAHRGRGGDQAGDGDGDGDDAPLPAPHRRHHARPTAPPTQAADRDDNPLGGAATGDDGAKPDAEGAGDASDAADPTEAGADDASASDDDFDLSSVTVEQPTLGLRAAVGVGLTGRSFSPGPATVPGYSSAPVGSVRLDAEILPASRVALALTAERTLAMTTPLVGGSAPTTMSRFQVSGAYAVTRGRVQLAPMIGLGRRSFVIQSTDPSRSPDGHYNYLIAGGRLIVPMGEKVSVGGMAAVEPVISGAEATMMSFGPARRWALEMGAAVEVRPRKHVFVRATADYQRFAWSWDLAGERGAGGAVDSYPSGAVSVGADY